MRKILSVLAPVLALAAFAVVPTMAQAEVQVGGEAAAGHEIQAFSNNLKFQTAALNLECVENDLNVIMQSNEQGDVNGGGFTGAGGGACGTSTAGVTADITTNASTGWEVVFQQGGVGHLRGIFGQPIQFTAQLQVGSPMGQVSIATCHYERSSVQFHYNENQNALVLHVQENENEFQLQQPEQTGNSVACSMSGKLHGQFEEVTSPDGAVVAHHTP